METTKAFWQTVPAKSLAGFLLGVFFIFSAIGFANDSVQMGRQPILRYALAVLASGLFAVGYATGGIIFRKRFWKYFPIITIAQFGLMWWLAYMLPDLPQHAVLGPSEISALQHRFVLDGIAVTLAIGIGYSCFLYVSITEARRFARVHTEIMLATEIHGVLVPTIDTSIGDFEFYGKALPASEVGGDLIDLFEHDGRWIAYIADVSGHGVAPGIVMAMVKSAARMQISSGQSSAQLLDRLNAVLMPIKKPAMFVTFAYIAWDGETLEYSMAGHPPILHFHAATGETTELECANFPVGMFGAPQFVSGRVHAAPGDLLMMFTDGVPEVTNQRDEEFGTPAVGALLAANARQPLAHALQAIVNATDKQGKASDDRSMLFVRLR